MCFSPEADLAAGVAVGVIGMDALHHVRRRAEVPMAVIPVVLAAHQLIETFVWWGLRGQVSASVWHPALWLYLTIAFGVLPVLVPVAVGSLKPEADRRLVGLLVATGVIVAIVLMYALVRGPTGATNEGHDIAYHVKLVHGGVIVGLYVAATCGSMLVSRDRQVRYFGVANLVAVAVLAWLATSGFISLWCAWAAVTSIAIATHLRHADRPPEQPWVMPATGSGCPLG